MKTSNKGVDEIPTSHRTVPPTNPSRMPIPAWRSIKGTDMQSESINTEFFFGRTDATNHSVTIDVPGSTVPLKVHRNPDNFHVAFRPVIIIAQCFAVLPVSGARSPNASYLKFKWWDWKVLYCAISFIGAAALLTCSIIRIATTGISATKTTTLAFFGSACLTSLLFLRLAINWPALGLAWEKVEKELTRRSFTGKRTSLKSKITLITTIIMTLSLIEHMLSIWNGYLSAKECASILNAENLLPVYFQTQFPQVFAIFPYALWKGCLLQVMNLLSTFSWNFMDLFLMLLSIALAERFLQLNERLYSIKGKTMPDWWWTEAREDYNRLASLTRHVDSVVSDIVLLSFANNLYFICIQLLNSLKPIRDRLQAIYFWFSFGFLLARTAAVSMYAASVNDQSLRPSPILYSVSGSGYTTEIQRFLIQVTTDKIGLTGRNFFSVTRSLILTVAGTIVTYELVLVQFNAMQTVDMTTINYTSVCAKFQLDSYGFLV